MQKILLIRFSSIGDIVLTTPVVRALKTQTGCNLHVLTKNRFANIYRNNPHVDRVHAFERSPQEVLPELQAEGFDFVVDLQKNLRSVRLRKKLGRPSASFPKLNKEKWLLVNLKVDRLPRVHIVDRYFQAVESLGVTPDGNGLDYFIPPSEETKPESLDPALPGGYVAFAIGGQHATKMMPAEKIAAVVSRLSAPVVLLGGKEDAEKGETVRNLVQKPDVFNACGRFSLDGSASLVKQARVVITHDTGLMHIAAAFEKPVVSIWGNTVPAFGMYPFLPGKEERSFLAEVPNLKCRPCSKLGFKKCPKGHFRCMMDQDENQIARQAMRFFEGKVPRKKV